MMWAHEGATGSGSTTIARLVRFEAGIVSRDVPRIERTIYFFFGPQLFRLRRSGIFKLFMEGIVSRFYLFPRFILGLLLSRFILRELFVFVELRPFGQRRRWGALIDYRTGSAPR
jgi:hypothetical protein